MLTGPAFDDNSSAAPRPAVVDGEFVWLPTLAGLLKGEAGVAAPAKRDLYSSVAAAVTSESAINKLEAELAAGSDLAQLLDVDPTG